MRKYILLAILVLSWLLFLYAALYYVSAYFYPDQCMDLGYVFDYVAWDCSLADHLTYIDVPFFRIPGFLPLAAAFVTATVATLVWHRYRRS
jgi:hypothetical protein